MRYAPGAYPECKLSKSRLPAYGLHADMGDGLELENLSCSILDGTVDLRPRYSFAGGAIRLRRQGPDTPRGGASCAKQRPRALANENEM